MSQVSRYPLRKEIENRMYEVFIDSISRVTTELQVEKLINDLLSPTEKVMLAKRLAIALLLLKEYDQRTISKVLRVSVDTVNKVNRSLKFGSGGYSMVIKPILEKEKQDTFWEKVDDKLAIISLPHHRNWGDWKKERWEDRIKKKKSL
jgi:uncharacterized protein YerC